MIQSLLVAAAFAPYEIALADQTDKRAVICRYHHRADAFAQHCTNDFRYGGSGVDAQQRGCHQFARKHEFSPKHRNAPIAENFLSVTGEELLDQDFPVFAAGLFRQGQGQQAILVCCFDAGVVN